MLRPTKIRALYCQCVGRGTRPSPETGKEDLLLLDFLWATQKHDLCRPASLISKSPDVVKKSVKVLEEQGGAMGLEELDKKTNEEIVTERENALAEQLKAMRKTKRTLVDPLQYAVSIQSKALIDYVPEFDWELRKPTETQLITIQKFGVSAESVKTKGEATVLLNELIGRTEKKLATPKQIRFLESRGFKHVGNWAFDDANKMISRYSMNHWMTPKGVIPEQYRP
jgi:type I site-specific restriction endonuclease